MSTGRHIVVQRTGFLRYFLCAWSDGSDVNGSASWDCLRARAIVFEAPTARRIANQLNARNPGAPLPVVVEALP